MSEHLTRKELKTDNVAITVEHAVHYYQGHRKSTLQIVGCVIIAAVLGFGIYFWMDHAKTVRQGKLADAMQIAEAQVGAPSQTGATTFPTQDAKDQAMTKAFTDLAAQYSGSNEGAVAEYSLASLAITAGKNDEARKHFQQVIDSGNKEYRSLAKLALAQLDFGDGKPADGEKLLRDLIDNPTTLVTKAQASITLARLIGPTRPADAKLLLAPFLKETGEVGQNATQVQTEITGK